MKWVQQRTKSLVSKNFLGMISISLAVLMMVSFVLFFCFRNEMVKSYRQLTKTTLNNTNVVLNQHILNVKSMLLEWYHSSDGTLLRLESEVDFVNHMPFVQLVINTLGNIPYSQSFFIINQERQVSIVIGAYTSYAKNMEKSLIEKIEKAETFNQPFVWRAKNQITGKEDIPLLTIPMGDTSIGSNYFNGMTVLNIDLVRLNKSLFSNQQGGDFKLFILDKHGNVAGASDMNHLGENWGEKDWVQKIIQGETFFKTKIDGKKWEINAVSSEPYSFYVVAQSEYVDRIENIGSIYYIVLLAIITAGIAIIILTLLVSRRIFEPFTALVENLKNSSISDNTENEEDEMVFLERVYQHASSRIDMLKEEKENDFIIKNLLLGNQEEEIQQLMLQKEIITEKGIYYMVIVATGDDAQNAFHGIEDYERQRNIISGIYKGMLNQYGTCTYFEIGLRKMLFIISETKTKVPEQETLMEALNSVKNSSLELFSVRLFTVLSDCRADGGGHCVTLFRQLVNCLKTKQLLGVQEAGTLCKKEEKLFSKEIQDRILTSLKERNKERYHSAVESMFKYYKNCEYPIFVEHMKHIADEILLISEMTGDLHMSAQKEDFKAEIENLRDKEGLLLWFENFFIETAIQINKVNNHSTASLMEDAVDYIRNNYEDSSLNVNTLADKLNVSAAYFGKLFHEFTGCKTLEYIMKIRMEKAHDLLLSEPGMDVLEVAAAVGYNNTTYFTTVFKKFFGVTPSKLRDHYAFKEK